MKKANNVRTRMAVLLGTLALMGLGTLPLIGQAQDATPSGAASEQQLIQEGEEIYTNVCIACHQPDGKGIQGIYPPLAGNPLLTTEDPSYFISVVLNGRGGMPAFRGPYDDEQIAAITTFVRQNWENDAGPVNPEQVAAIRGELGAPPAEAASPEVATPEGQIPSGIVSSTPESGAFGSPEATP